MTVSRIDFTRALRAAGVLVALAGCSSVVDADDGQKSTARLSFPSGQNAGYCASNPSANCDHGTPVAAKQLALTFDDGPGSQTLALSSYLKSRGIRATFFVNSAHLGSDAAALLGQLVADGHLVGNHTKDHSDLTSIDDAAIIDELTKTDAIIAPFVPNGRFVFRAPYGAWSAHVYDVLHASAMDKYAGPVNWDIGGEMTSRYAADWACWENANGQSVMTTKQCGDRYLAEITDIGRGIVLMHDQDYGDVSNHDLTKGRGNTVDMVKYLVEGSSALGVKGLEARGYTFLRVDEVPDVAAALPPAGGGGSDGGGACWSPSWQQTTDANEWWVEYETSDKTVTSAYLEVVGGRDVSLSLQWGAWVGPTGARIPSGTQVVVHATGAKSQTTKTQPFGYLVTTKPVTSCAGACTPSCTNRTCGDDGCGGSCETCAADKTCSSGACTGGGACWSPSWQQTTDANEWWVEYEISDKTATSAYLEVVGGRNVPLSLQWGAWVGPTGARIRSGTQVVVHATNAAAEIAKTQPFGYLTVRAPKTQCAP